MTEEISIMFEQIECIYDAYICILKYHIFIVLIFKMQYIFL